MQGREFSAEILGARRIVESTSEEELVPLDGKRADDLVQHRDGELGELIAAGAVLAEDLSGTAKDGEDTIRLGFFIAMLHGQ